MMELLWTKLFLIPALLIINVLLGYVPFYFFYLKRRPTKSSSHWSNKDSSQPLLNNSETESGGSHSSQSHDSIQSTHKSSQSMDRILSLANCFSAGVFLATCFVGLLPSVQQKYHHIIEMIQTPTTQTTHDMHHHHHHHHLPNNNNDTHHHINGMIHTGHHAGNKHMHTYPLPEVCICMGFFLVWTLKICLNYCLSAKEEEKTSISIQNGSSSQSISKSSKTLQEKTPIVKESPNCCMEDSTDPETVNSHSLPIQTMNHPPKGSLLKSMLLLMALSSHSVIEGVAFGLLDSAAQVINVAVAMLLHECLCTFCLSVNLARDEGVSKYAGMLIMTAFSLLIPVGIVCGMLLYAKAEASITGEVVSMMFQGMASGTFLFIVFLEILPAEMKFSGDGGAHAHHGAAPVAHSSHDSKAEFDSLSIKLLCCIFGFLCIALLRLFHSH